MLTMDVKQQHTHNYNTVGQTIDSLLIRIFNPIAVRKAKIVYNFGLSECNRVKIPGDGVSFPKKLRFLH